MQEGVKDIIVKGIRAVDDICGLAREVANGRELIVGAENDFYPDVSLPSCWGRGDLREQQAYHAGGLRRLGF